MDFDGIIFDLDGTLWDCTAETAEAMTAVYGRLGFDKFISRNFIRSISGKTWSEFDGALLDGVPREFHEALRAELVVADAFVAQQFATEVLYEGVIEGLAKLERHYPLFLVSNCGAEYLHAFLHSSGAGGFFTDSECYGRSGMKKSENILALIERRSLKAACYVGDTAGDESAAREAGLPFYHARYGFGEPKQCVDSFGNFAELVQFFIS